MVAWFNNNTHMNLPSKKHGFTLIELLVVISIIGILASLAIPAVGNALTRGQMTQTLNNARQLQIATQTMSMDTFTSGNGLAWTTDENGAGIGLSTYVSALVDDNYLTRSDLNKLFSAPGVTRASDADPATGTIAFSIFAVSENSPGSQPFVVTRNWNAGTLDATRQPYGNKGFVIFRKGGEGSINTRATEATRIKDEIDNEEGVEGTLIN